MASNIYLLDVDEDGNNLHLAGTKTPYNGSGEPWNTQSTSPYLLSMNDTTGGVWTPTAPPRVETWGGNPPFRVGSELISRSYGNVEETVGVQMYATSHDNAVALLRTLRRALAATLTRRPAILVVQPDGASQPVYYEVYGATVQEAPAFLHNEARNSSRIVRALITWTRSPFGGRLSNGETLANAVNVTNTPSGTPNHLVALSSASGDLTTEGGPLNVTVDASGAPWGTLTPRLFLATVAFRAVTSDTSTLVTSSTAGALAKLFSSVSVGASAFLSNPSIRGRVIVRATGVSANLELQARVGLADTFHVGPWVRASASGGANVWLDLGAVPPPSGVMGAGITSVSVSIYARSMDGAATSGSLAYMEWLSAYTVGETAALTDPGIIYVESFLDETGRVALPRPVGVRTSRPGTGIWRGKAPVAIQGASLYVAWRDSSNAHDPTEAALVTVAHAPLYHTFRGNG